MKRSNKFAKKMYKGAIATDLLHINYEWSSLSPEDQALWTDSINKERDAMFLTPSKEVIDHVACIVAGYIRPGLNGGWDSLSDQDRIQHRRMAREILATISNQGAVK